MFGFPDQWIQVPNYLGYSSEFSFMKFTVYILFSNAIKKYYTGQTKDLENRLAEHNNGETNSTHHGRPWILIYKSEFETRGEALKRENKIKKRGARRFLDDLNF